MALRGSSVGKLREKQQTPKRNSRKTYPKGLGERDCQSELSRENSEIYTGGKSESQSFTQIAESVDFSSLSPDSVLPAQVPVTTASLPLS